MTARNPDHSAVPVRLTETDWPALAQSVKETLVLQMQRDPLHAALARIRLVVSLRLIADAGDAVDAGRLNCLLAWLGLQCQRIEVTASRLGEHRLYLEWI